VGIGAQGSFAEHAACTTFEGDMHELAALALAIQLSLEGRRVSYLGPNLPAEEAVAFCKSQSVKMLCVSVIRRPDEAALTKYLKVIAQIAQTGTRVVLGGRQLSDFQSRAPLGVEIVPDWQDFDSTGAPN
jgi:methanogenic corrinoid protein MtbC1